VGGAAKRAAIARFTATFGFMQRAAVPLSDAVRQAAGATGNSLVARRVAAPAAMLESGGKLAACLRATGIFSPSQVSVLTTGEETGTLDSALSQLSEKARQERDSFLKIATTGGCVAGFLIAALAVLLAAIAGWAAIYDNVFKVFESSAWQP
jgi:type II secretory pathway component PulF